MDFKENGINIFSILALVRGPIVWPSRARFGPWAANWRPLPYTLSTTILNLALFSSSAPVSSQLV